MSEPTREKILKSADELNKDAIWCINKIMQKHSAAVLEEMRDQLKAKDKKYKALRKIYDELIMAVAQKFPDESRHSTALRYITERESICHGPEQSSVEL